MIRQLTLINLGKGEFQFLNTLRKNILKGAKTYKEDLFIREPIRRRVSKQTNQSNQTAKLVDVNIFVSFDRAR